MNHDPDFVQSELQRFADLVDVDLTVDDGEYTELLDNLREHIAKGIVIIEDDGTAVYTMRRPDAPFEVAKFGEPTGRHMKALDKAGEGHNMARLYAFIAAMVGQPEKSLANAGKKDLGVLTDLARFSLA